MSIVAVHDEHVPHLAGCISWWSLEGEVVLDDLQDALLAHKVELATPIPEPSQLQVLQRAMLALKSPRDLVRPVQRGVIDFVQETVEEDQLHYRARLRATAATDADQIMVSPMTPEDLELAEELKAEIVRYKDVRVPTDLSGWFGDVLVELKAVSLRDRGGVWFIPSGKAYDTWKALRSALSSCSKHRLETVPAMRTEDTVELVLRSLVDEAQREYNELLGYLSGAELSTRGLNSSERKVRQTADLVAHYKDLLGAKLPELDVAYENVCAALMGAQLRAAQAKKEKTA